MTHNKETNSINPKERTIIHCGALLRRQFRTYLKSLAFWHQGLEWLEDRRLIESIFYIKGPEKAIKTIEDKEKEISGI